MFRKQSVPKLQRIPQAMRRQHNYSVDVRWSCFFLDTCLLAHPYILHGAHLASNHFRRPFGHAYPDTWSPEKMTRSGCSRSSSLPCTCAARKSQSRCSRACAERCTWQCCDRHPMKAQGCLVAGSVMRTVTVVEVCDLHDLQGQGPTGQLEHGAGRWHRSCKVYRTRDEKQISDHETTQLIHRSSCIRPDG